MSDGLPLSEAALRRRRRQRRRAAACASVQAGSGSGGRSLGVQDCYARTYVPGESGGSGCGGGGYIDVRGHVVVALRCLAEALELQMYDVGVFAEQAWAEDTSEAVFPWCDVSGTDVATLGGAAESQGVFPGTTVHCGGVFAAEVGEKVSLSLCEHITGIGRPTSPEVQSDIAGLEPSQQPWAFSHGAVSLQQVDVTQQVEAEFFECGVLKPSHLPWAFSHGAVSLQRVDVTQQVVVEPAAGSECLLDEDDEVLRDLLDLREAVRDARDVPGRSQQQCFAVVRSALERSAEISDLSPAAAVVLAEIQLHMGQPSLPAVSGELALPAGSFDADALLEGVFADDLEPEGLFARGSPMQESAVSVATSFALDLESEGMCARGISIPETAHVSIGHGGEEKVTPSPSANAHVVSGRCLYRGLFTTVQRSYSSIRKGSLAAKAVFVEVGKRGSLCIAWLVAISLLFYCLCCCLDLHVGNFTVSELGRPAQFFEVQGTFSGVSTRGELSVVAEGSAELQLSEGDLVPDSRGVDVVGAGPAADAGRDSRSKSTTAATKNRKKGLAGLFRFSFRQGPSLHEA